MRIMIVGEAWGEKEEDAGEPFVGPSGQVLNSMLRAAGIDRSACYLTNVFNFRPLGNKLSSLAGPKTEGIPDWPRLGNKMYIRAAFKPELNRLFREVETFDPTLIIALGATPLWALCKELGIKKYRGTPTLDWTGTRKVFPTYHPSAIMRQWKLRPVAIADLTKAAREAQFRELRRPSRELWLEPTLADIEEFWTKYLKPSPVLGADIETKQGTITEVGFANEDGSRAIVIPFWSRTTTGGNYWHTLEDEIAAWSWVRHICRSKPLAGQNFMYDLTYLWRTMGIACPLIADDTMILHHAMYPEMEKSLGFLGSIYTDEPSWKFMRTDAEKLKAEDD